MRVAVALLVSLLIVSTGSAQMPEDAVRGFVAAWNKKDLVAAGKFVHQSRGADPLLESLKQSQQGWPVVKLTKVAAKVQGDKATLTTVSSMSGVAGVPKESQTETFGAVKAGGKWLLVAPPGGAAKSILPGLLQMFSGPPIFERAKGAAQATKCLSNLKQIAVAIHLFASDNDGRLAFNAANWKAKLMPYLKNEQVFVCPLAKTNDSYSINPALFGKTLNSAKFPSDTVLVFEGKGGKPVYRHDGKAAMGTVNAACRHLASKAVARLRWKP